MRQLYIQVLIGVVDSDYCICPRCMRYSVSFDEIRFGRGPRSRTKYYDCALCVYVESSSCTRAPQCGDTEEQQRRETCGFTTHLDEKRMKGGGVKGGEEDVKWTACTKEKPTSGKQGRKTGMLTQECAVGYRRQQPGNNDAFDNVADGQEHMAATVLEPVRRDT